jgi:hypothetical protein
MRARDGQFRAQGDQIAAAVREDVGLLLDELIPRFGGVQFQAFQVGRLVLSIAEGLRDLPHPFV